MKNLSEIRLFAWQILQNVKRIYSIKQNYKFIALKQNYKFFVKKR